MKQKVQVIMLATTIEKATYPKSLMKCIQSYDGGWIDNFHNKVDKGELFYGFSDLTQGIWELQHLYFLSGEPILKDDYYLNQDNVIFKSNGILNQEAYIHCKKIVCSTDSSLNFPLIPESFVKEFVESQGSIKEVEIEMEYLDIGEDEEILVPYLISVVDENHKNMHSEVVICKENEQLYTKKDLRNAFEAGIICGTDPDSEFNTFIVGKEDQDEFEQWFNEQNF